MTKPPRILVPLLVLVVAAGCGSGPKATAPTPGSSTTDLPSTPCAAQATVKTRAEVMGDGHRYVVAYSPAGQNCSAELHLDSDPAVSLGLDDLPLAPHGLRAVTVPGRSGQLVLLVQTSPRGGYQAHLFGFANQRFEELKVEGHPALPFVATDTASQHLGASCEDNGYVTRIATRSGKRTWDVSRTVHRIDGNSVTAGATTRVATGVSDLDFQKRYGDIAGDQLLTDCS